MHPVFGTYHEGRIILDASVDWPEGCRLLVHPADGEGLVEANWIDTPEWRTVLAARLDALEPLELTPEDEATIAAAREQVRQISILAVKAKMGLPA